KVKVGIEIEGCMQDAPELGHPFGEDFVQLSALSGSTFDIQPLLILGVRKSRAFRLAGNPGIETLLGDELPLLGDELSLLHPLSPCQISDDGSRKAATESSPSGHGFAADR